MLDFLIQNNKFVQKMRNFSQNAVQICEKKQHFVLEFCQQKTPFCVKSHFSL